MSDEEMLALVTEFGLAGEAADIAYKVAREVERNTRRTCFRLIQDINNAASNRAITPGELDVMLWNHANDKRKNQ